MRIAPLGLCVIVLLGAVPAGVAEAQRVPAGRVVANDNTRPAGRVRGSVLELRLIARMAEWRPGDVAEAGAVMQVFAEEGRSPQIPGPLIRVTAGRVAAVTLRNALTDTMRVHGLHDRVTGVADTLPFFVAPGESKTVRMRLDAPGTYFYWATTTGRAINWRTGLDSQLSGVIVVDSAGERPRAHDRILVVGMWSDTVHRAGTQRKRVLAVVNGRTWPHTERMQHSVGDTVRWRLVNTSADLHPMHLHGFYFQVASRGTFVRRLSSRMEPPVVTENLVSGGTLDIRWVPQRAGNWLFHCHVAEHFSTRGALGVVSTVTHDHSTDHASDGMGGMVVGIRVRGRADPSETRAIATAPGRSLRLVARENLGSTDSIPLYSYALHAPNDPEPSRDSGMVASSVIDLIRGEPVRITVVNRLREPTAVHWHGIELDSYYDGVPGFSGDLRRVTPLIAPGDSFVVRFTPPRAGTFIYHTHASEVRQQTAGLAGALVVREAGTTRDTAVDIPIVLTSPTDFSLNAKAALLNGVPAPAPRTLVAGQTYRFRFIGMSVPRVAMSVEMRLGDSLATWRRIAKDGADLPTMATEPSQVFVAVGETYDVLFTPHAPGEWNMRVLFGLNQAGRPVGPVTELARWRFPTVSAAR